jgi:hypothetical protein
MAMGVCFDLGFSFKICTFSGVVLMNLRKLAWLGFASVVFQASASQGALLSSWENSEEGWIIQQPAYSTAGFSTTTGVSNQTYSWIVAGNASPTYGVMFEGPSTLGNTAVLSVAATLSVDVTVPVGGDFGWFQQWTAIIDNADTGYVSLDGYSYSQSPNIGSATPKTLIWTVPGGIRSTLASSANPTKVVFQVGGGSNGTINTMYLDNLRTTVPEPASVALLASCALGMFVSRPKRVG